MSSTVSLHLTPFGAQSLDSLARNGAPSKASTLRTAVLYYLSERDSGRAAWRVPRHSVDNAERDRALVEVELDGRTWSELADEAARQQVASAELAAHALLYFLADIHSGRVSATLAACSRDDPASDPAT